MTQDEYEVGSLENAEKFAIIRMARENDEVPCKSHPEAPHGFCRDASLSYDRYVCECEFWEPEENKIYTQAELESAVLAEREACAKVCEEVEMRFGRDGDHLEQYGANQCAAAIRARGNDAS